MADKILGSIYLGDKDDAPKFEGEIICVLQDIPKGEPKEALWIPIVRSSTTLTEDQLVIEQDTDVYAQRSNLDLIARILEENWEENIKTLVHCIGGIERSPLAIVYWLQKYHSFTFNTAYERVQKIRPQVQNRLIWLNMTYDEHMS